jgi:hypothetical protein
LTFLPTPDGWVPETIVVTPPDATTQLQVPWIPAVSTANGVGGEVSDHVGQFGAH